MSVFYSTNQPQLKVPLEEALLHGLAADGGLYMPVSIPLFPKGFFEGTKSLHEIALTGAELLLGKDIPKKTLQHIVESAFTFDAPLVPVSEGMYSLELFHGPTLSFKDFGARFMAELMQYFVLKRDKELHILVATSGDTGSAVAHAFLNRPHIHVWVLYPSGKVSPSQEKQLTTMGGNVTALEVEGSFDDCQKLVKQAFSDPELRKTTWLTSANSINIARLLPQAFYYIYGYFQLPDKKIPSVISVPSGNFGNLMAGLLAKKMGLPIKRFIAATNINDTVPRYFRSGVFEPKASVPTLSNAMDVGNPSNFARMLDLFHHNLEEMRKEIFVASFTDKETTEAVIRVFRETGYLLDPHGAVAYLGLSKYRDSHEGDQGIFLETAHPGKFADDVKKMIGSEVPIPERLQQFLSREKHSVKLPSNYPALKAVLQA